MLSNFYRTRWKILICIILEVHEQAPAYARVVFYLRYIYCKLITYNCQIYWRESTKSAMHVLEEQLIFDLSLKTILIHSGSVGSAFGNLLIGDTTQFFESNYCWYYSDKNKPLYQVNYFQLKKNMSTWRSKHLKLMKHFSAGSSKIIIITCQRNFFFSKLLVKCLYKC